MKSFTKYIFISLFFLPFAVSASGFGGTGGPDLSADYNVGKKVFYTQVVCASCPYPDLSIPDGIVGIGDELKRSGAIGKKLSLRERKSVKLFLNEQFGIRI